MLTVILAAIVSAPSLADDVPRGTDVVARVEVGRLAGDARDMWQDMGDLLDAWPPIKRLSETALETWTDRLTELEAHTGADLDHKSSVVTLTADLDATGGTVWAVVARGVLTAGPAPKAAEDVESFTVDGHPAFRLAGADAAWAVVAKKILVFGNERGLQRQLRRLLAKSRERKEPLQILASRMRTRAPLLMAFSLPDELRAAVKEVLATAGPLVATVRSGSVSAGDKQIVLRLEAKDTNEQEALEHGVRSIAALLRAGAALLEGGAEAVIGLDIIGARPAQLPESLGRETIEELIETWLQGARFDLSMRRRRPHSLEVTIKPSSYRAFLAAIGVMAVGLAPTPAPSGKAEAQVMLMALRQAEMAHKARTGEYLSCGPVPLDLPEGRVDWPEASCFDIIGFRPPGKVRFQVAAGVEEGTLVMMARGDTDGDGVAEVWLLDETSVSVEPFVPP